MSQAIGKLFDRIAPTYDRLNHILSLGLDYRWRDALSSCVPKTTLRILDVATGSGDVLIKIVRDHPELLEAVGVDISENLLAIARKKAITKHIRATFMQGDAHRLPFEDNHFDVITCAFGVRNFKDRQRALRELLRIVRPNGKLIILELGMSDNRIIHYGYTLYFKHVMPIIGGALSGDKKAYRYLYSSVNAFPSPDIFMKHIQEAGFHNVGYTSLTLGTALLFTAEKK